KVVHAITPRSRWLQGSDGRWAIRQHRIVDRLHPRYGFFDKAFSRPAPALRQQAPLLQREKDESVRAGGYCGLHQSLVVCFRGVLTTHKAYRTRAARDQHSKENAIARRAP